MLARSIQQQVYTLPGPTTIYRPWSDTTVARERSSNPFVRLTEALAVHERWTARALNWLAELGVNASNPMVGALIVEAGEVVAEGWHAAAGQAHAEVQALRALGRKPAPDATLYVTLEPCSTKGVRVRAPLRSMPIRRVWFVLPIPTGPCGRGLDTSRGRC